MKKLFLMFVTLMIVVPLLGCGSEEIPAGYKGFQFDRTGSLLLFAGGDGLLTEQVLESGTHYTGIYDSIRGANCQHAHTREALSVLTRSDMEVMVDLRITYSADCSTRETLETLVTEVQPAPESLFIQPEAVFTRYIMPVIRESLRNHLAEYTLEEVKDVRGGLATSIKEDLEAAINAREFPVVIEVLTVSSITLPASITEKIGEIEVARMNVNQERERRRASEVRLERELFEAQQQRAVSRENAQREEEIRTIQANAELEVQRRHAEGISEIRRQLTPEYIEYLRLHKEAEVQTEIAHSLGEGTVFYLGQEFLVPPNSSANVSVSH